MKENGKEEGKWKRGRKMEDIENEGMREKKCLFLTQKETTFRMTGKYPFSGVKVAQIADKGKESA